MKGVTWSVRNPSRLSSIQRLTMTFHRQFQCRYEFTDLRNVSLAWLKLNFFNQLKSIIFVFKQWSNIQLLWLGLQVDLIDIVNRCWWSSNSFISTRMGSLAHGWTIDFRFFHHLVQQNKLFLTRVINNIRVQNSRFKLWFSAVNFKVLQVPSDTNTKFELIDQLNTLMLIFSWISLSKWSIIKLRKL